MQLFVGAHPVEVKHTVASDGVIIENLVKFAKAEEKNLVIVVLLQSPVLNHRAR